ncbi:RraA family protein [Mycobacterium sp. E796]|uniref:RraA family protein n=1 Tax=Mycobacterium sp. E796 TaxID=1834151 RepID=UPI000A8089DA|nr:RraA family protein [Mycobacterium sp. E796]
MESLEALASRVRTAGIVDAMGRRHRHRCHLLDLVSPTPGRRLFGPDVTISYFPARRAALPPERYNFKTLFYDAIEGGADGCVLVLVLASNGYTDASLGGGTKLPRVRNHRLAGILADGRLRDFAELELYDLAIYCRGETTRWGGDIVTPYEANRPIVVAGGGGPARRLCLRRCLRRRGHTHRRRVRCTPRRKPSRGGGRSGHRHHQRRNFNHTGRQ